MTLTIDEPKIARLTLALDAYRNALIGAGKDVSEILKQEHRLLCRKIVNFTPPLPQSSAKVSGELAVKKDLYSLISEAPEPMLRRLEMQSGTMDIDAWDTVGGRRRHLVWKNIVTNPSELEALHGTFKNSRGRVPREKNSEKDVWRSRIVVPVGMRDPYVRKIQSRVGYWKAKWAYGAAQLGDTKYPAWITRHFAYVKKDSFITDNSAAEQRPSIEFGGRGPNFRRDMGRVNDAIQSRVKSIISKVKLVLSDYAADTVAGILAKPTAKRHETAVEEVD